jgi:hypothetical protein
VSDERIRVATPAEVDVELECPTCGVVETVGAKLATRLVVERGAASRLSLRVRSLRLEHVCGQETLALLARDEGDA